jgi:hypothetical protein
MLRRKKGFKELNHNKLTEKKTADFFIPQTSEELIKRIHRYNDKYCKYQSPPPI